MSSDNTQEPAEPPIPEVAWDIRREGRAWGADEAQARFALTPEKFEMWGRPGTPQPCTNVW
jgi:hypothetical protein